MCIKTASIIFVLMLAMSFTTARAAEVSNNSNPVTDFIGRHDEIKRLASKLSSNNYVYIAGMPGIGKTEVVRKFLQDKANNYNVIWWWDMGADVIQQNINFTHNINEKICKKKKNCYLDLQSDHKILFQKVSDLIAKNKIKTIFIIDNILNLDKTIERFIDCLDNPYIKIIFIGIKKQFKKNEIIISELKAKDAKDYLRNNIALTEYEAEDLARILSYYPLAISTTVRFFNEHKSVSVKIYKDLLIANDKRIYDVKLNNSESRYDKSPYSAINLSIFKIKEEDAKAYALLTWASYLYNEDISEDILRTLYFQTFQNVTLLDYINSISKLESYMLLKVVTMQKDNSKKITLHNILKQIMHSEIGDELAHNKNTRKALDSILEVLPKSSNPIALEDYITKHPEVLTNANEILKLVDYHNIYDIKRLDLEVRLLRIWMFDLNYVQLIPILDRLDTTLDKYKFKNDEREKANALIATFLYLKGAYLDFAKSDYKKSIQAFQKAEQLLQNAEEENDVRYNLLLQHAQTLLYAGKLNAAEDYINKIEVLLKKPDFPKVNVSLFYFIKAKLQLEKGQYDNGIKWVKNCKKSIVDIYTEPLLIISSSVPVDLLYSEILLRMGKKEEAYEIANKANKAYKESLGTVGEEHELYARVLLTLSTAEAAIDKSIEAKKHIEKSISIIKNKYSDNERDLLKQDDDLASALIVKGDINTTEGNNQAAITNYLEAKEILHTRYENIVEIYKLSELYLKILAAALKNDDRYLADKFFEMNKKHFGINQSYTQEMIKLLSADLN